MKQVLRDGISCDQVVQSSLELWLPLTKPYSHAAQEQRLWQEQILVKLWIRKVIFLMEHLKMAQCLQALLLKPRHKMTLMIITVMTDHIILVIWMINPQSPHLHPQDPHLAAPHLLHNTQNSLGYHTHLK